MASSFSPAAPLPFNHPPAPSSLSLHLPTPPTSLRCPSSPVLLLSASDVDPDLILISDDDGDDDGHSALSLQAARPLPPPHAPPVVAPSTPSHVAPVSDVPSPTSSDSRTDTEDEGEAEMDVDAAGEASTQENRDLHEEDFHASQKEIEAEQLQLHLHCDASTPSAVNEGAEKGEAEDGSSPIPPTDTGGSEQAVDDDQQPPPAKRQKVEEAQCEAQCTSAAAPSTPHVKVESIGDGPMQAAASLVPAPAAASTAITAAALSGDHSGAMTLQFHPRAVPVPTTSSSLAMIDLTQSQALKLPQPGGSDTAYTVTPPSAATSSQPSNANTSICLLPSASPSPPANAAPSLAPSASAQAPRPSLRLTPLLPFVTFPLPLPRHGNIRLSTTPHRTIFSAPSKPPRQPIKRRLCKAQMKSLSEVELHVRLEEIEEEVTELDEAMEKDERPGVEVMRGYEEQQDRLQEEMELIEDELKHRREEERKATRREARAWQLYNGPGDGEEEEEEGEEGEEGEDGDDEEEGGEEEEDSGDVSEESGDEDMSAEEERAEEAHSSHAQGEAAEPFDPFSSEAPAPDAASYFEVVNEMSAIYQVDEAEFKRITAEAARRNGFTSKQLFKPEHIERADASEQQPKAALPPPADEEKRALPPSSAPTAPSPANASLSDAEVRSPPSQPSPPPPPAAPPAPSLKRPSSATLPSATPPITAFFHPAPAARRKILPTLFTSSFNHGSGGSSAVPPSVHRPSVCPPPASSRLPSSSSLPSVSKLSRIRYDGPEERTSPLPATDDIRSVIDLTDD